MKRIGILIWVVCAVFSTLAWAQQRATPRAKGHLSRHLAQRAQRAKVNKLSASNLMASAPKTMQLGTYPGGAWAALGGINDFGVAVGVGDVPPLNEEGVGATHALAVPVVGPRVGQWIDLGTLGSDDFSGWTEPLNQVSSTGVAVGHSATASGYVHGFAWTERTGMVDLGTLADIGYPEYNSSFATATNRLGTLIVGWSGIELSCLDCAAALPVVWTPSTAWRKGEWTTKWTIHKLDTSGFPDFVRWYPFSVNDFGQIVAAAWNSEETIEKPMIWNLRVDGKSWKVSALPVSPDYPFFLPFNINDQGEIAGAALSEDASVWRPRLWQPLNAKRTTYRGPIKLAVPAGYDSCETAGINETGDMSGDCWNDTTDQIVHWATKNPNFNEVIALGDWSFSFGVNNFGIASATYGDADCASCGGVVRVH